MAIRTKIAAVLAGTAMAGLGMVATAPSASADNCPTSYLCAYLAPGFSGAPGKVAGDNSNLLQYYKFNNAESLWNAGRCNVRIFSGTGPSGFSQVLASNWTFPNLAGSAFYHNVAANDFCV